MTEEQRACAFDFLVNGDERGLHVKRCVWPKYGQPACSREYDPGPAPDDVKLYEGSQLGVLWGITPNPENVVALMQATRRGWTIKPRSAS
jgi:hypothetical protein